MATAVNNRNEWLKIGGRDKQIILTIYKLRLMKQDHIRRLFFSKAQKARARLKFLYDAGLLDRFRPPKRFGQGTSQYIYSLSKVSAKFIAAYFGEEKIGWKRKHKSVEMLFLKHALAISEFYVGLKEKEDSWHKLAEWLSESEIINLVYEKSSPIRPDAYFNWSIIEEDLDFDLESYFFLEIDMGTMRSKAIAEKTNKYAKYYLTNNYVRHFNRIPNVMSVTTSEVRLLNLMKTTEKELKRLKCDILPFYFTTLERIKIKGILGSIWQPSFDDELKNLDEIP